MEQNFGIQATSTIGKSFNDAYQTTQIGLENSTLSGMQALYNTLAVGFDKGDNTKNITPHHANEIKAKITSVNINPNELQNQSELLARANRAYFFSD